MHTRRINGLLAAFFVLASAAAAAGEQGSSSTLGVSVRVVAPHQPALARSLPLPSPGHVMQEDVRGRHYFFDGAMTDARDYYDTEMRRRGYVLRNVVNDEGYSTEMRWVRTGEVALVQMRSTPGRSPTRISLLVMAD